MEKIITSKIEKYDNDEFCFTETTFVSRSENDFLRKIITFWVTDKNLVKKRYVKVTTTAYKRFSIQYFEETLKAEDLTKNYSYPHSSRSYFDCGTATLEKLRQLQKEFEEYKQLI